MACHYYLYIHKNYCNLAPQINTEKAKNKREMNKTRIIVMSLALGLYTATWAGGKPKKAFIPMDYSTCGYHASELSIPDVRNVVTVTKTQGDCSSRIQKAIDYVASMKADKNGHRGTILIGEGTFYLEQPLRISASGVVLRGMGKNKTRLVKKGFDREALIYIEGKNSLTKADTIKVADQKLAAGSNKLTLASAAKVKAGDRIMILRPSTKEWIAALKCDDFGGGLDYTGWKPTDIDMLWNRTITSVDGNNITIDAPLTMTIDQLYGNASLITSYNKGEITECGVENMTIESAHNDWNPKDEDHCWDGVWMNYTSDCWVRRVDFKHFAGSAVNLQKQTRRTTVEDCVASEPVSEIGGWRRRVFLTRGEQNLFQRCVSKDGYHDFAADYCAAGPNAFVQCDGEGSLSFSGSIGSWAPGLLFDVVNIEGNDLSFRNLENWQMGTGWNTANSMFWQCTASTLFCYSPDKDNRCSANACWGTMTGNGEWSGSNDAVTPRSLFYDQLQKRVGEKANNGFVYNRNITASSSPTIEVAQKLALESVTTPRVTIEMWMDSIPYTANVSKNGLKDIDNIKFGRNNKSSAKDLHSKEKNFAITDGHLTFDGKLIVGNRFAIPWWNGRTKDNFILKSAKPAITRFVPGREGTGWTDRIDSVVTFLKDNDYCMLDQHYGLWYDLRRIDHERVKRSDGEVSAPFYEQPFARSGKGKAWEGLSKYDLTKPNEWYWQREREFAETGAKEGLLLFNHNYFQHNIIEAGAHWVDSPWRPVNNINNTNFPEPVPFAGDKRVFMAEQFYNENDPALRPLHKSYIRMCLDQLKDNDNVVQLISEEYTGPLHFTRFWLQTVAEWEKETGKHPIIALSCTKDAQDSILADPELSKVVDVIDIRYWHYNTDGLWAPPAGKNMAPRQFMRKMKVGKTGYKEAYKSVSEYKRLYPQKAVTFFAQQYPQYGWAILMAGGSLPNIPVKDVKFLTDAAKMYVMANDGGDDSYDILGNPDVGYIVYTHNDREQKVAASPGKYNIYAIDKSNGTMKILEKKISITSAHTIPQIKSEQVYWFEKI